MPQKTVITAADLVGAPPSDGKEKKEKVVEKTISTSKVSTPKVARTIEKSAKKDKPSDVVKSSRSSIPSRPTRSTRPTRPTITTRNARPTTTTRNARPSHRNSSNSRYSRSMQDADLPTETIVGILDTSRDGHGILRVGFSESDGDAYISSSQIRRFKLRPGDKIKGPARKPKENERYWGLLKVEEINSVVAEEYIGQDRIKFQSLTPVYPEKQIKLEIGTEPLDLRIIDMVAPIGRGQRSLIVSPPKAGKTTLLKNISTGIAKNYDDIHVMAVLVGERPEEVTDIRRHIEEITDGKGEVAASNFDESAQDQCRVAELALERAKRLVEKGQDVVILLDSITRLARAYNLAMPTSGRTLSGGFDPAALFPPKRFFGAARSFENRGSLTIIGTALVDTGSRMDDLIYEEFKGTGNQEVHLDRALGERRIYPALDVRKSGTRRDDLLIDSVTYQSILTLHRMMDTLGDKERTSTLLNQLKKTKTNKEFLAALKVS
jgi:transcription termination factor Rho